MICECAPGARFTVRVVAPKPVCCVESRESHKRHNKQRKFSAGAHVITLEIVNPCLAKTI